MSSHHAGAPGSACPGCSARTGAARRHPRHQDGKARAPPRSKFWRLITCMAKNLCLISHLNLSGFPFQPAVLVLHLRWIKEPSVPGPLPVTALTLIKSLLNLLLDQLNGLCAFSISQRDTFPSPKR